MIRLTHPSAIVAACLGAGLSISLAAQSAPASQPLTLAQAEQMALAHNPQMTSARLLALAQMQVTREARSAEMPTAVGNLTAVDAHHNGRITAGVLNNPSVYDRAAGGLTLTQLLTDFGRTRNLVRSAQSQAAAEASTQRATAADITLAVDEAFYRALSSQQVVQVAQSTVDARQATEDQINALASAKLKSSLDLSFAQVQLSQAKLMLLDAQNTAADSMAALDALLGSETGMQYTLSDDTTAALPPPPQDADALLQTAFQQRPDLVALNERARAAEQYSAAERDLNRPTVSAIGTAGGAPVRSDDFSSSWYGAAGVNVSIPVFNGFLFSARAQEASLRARAAQQDVLSLRLAISRDLRTAVLQAQAAFQRIAVTTQLLNQANQALDLAQTRYKLGLSGIVELDQAQLGQTQAQIDATVARSDYESALAAIRYQTGQ
ncbi:MAG TPA: TolC family protein [Terracidiphilus sp.]|nr:TolC family protein [Terracidiphilus sp.]